MSEVEDGGSFIAAEEASGEGSLVGAVVSDWVWSIDDVFFPLTISEQIISANPAST
jgi:hypothetical protein